MINPKNTFNDYLKKWDTRSLIRTQPIKLCDFNQEGLLFPPKQQVLLSLPEVIALGEEVKKQILSYSLGKYINDVINEEIKIVNSVCREITEDLSVIKYPPEIKLGAYTVIIDEYYHVYIAQFILEELFQHFPSIKEMDFPIPDTCHAATVIGERLEPECREIFKIMAACIFETTIAKELVSLTENQEINSSLRNYITGHLSDEARHHIFFYELLTYTWNHLSENTQKQIGMHLADFLILYLNIDSEKKFNYELLKFFLKDENKAHNLIEEIYGGFQITTEMPIVKQVLRVLKKSFIMDHKFVKESFLEKNLYIA